jgi:hypothetical protein
MDKETVKRLADEFGNIDELPAEEIGQYYFECNEVGLLVFAQACCDWQKEKDAQICDRIAKISKVDALAELCADACASAIRNTKDTVNNIVGEHANNIVASPETDLDHAQRFM